MATKDQLEREMENEARLRAVNAAVESYRGAVTRILYVRNGIEMHEGPDGYSDPTCGRCGGATPWLECDQCDEGYSHHECGEDSCACLHPENNVVCDKCLGSCGRHVCANSRDWCEDHPLPGRGEVESTAMTAEMWREEL